MACALALVLVAPAMALEDPDTEVAKKHFEKGRTFYDAQDYRHALDEFLTAKRAKSAPALDYNIARCYDRLEEYPAAIRHYQAYLDGKPNAADISEVRDRVAVLKRRVEEMAPPPAPPKNEPAASPAPQPLDQAVIIPTTFGTTPAAPEDDARARRRRNGAIAGGIIGGAVVIAGAVLLGVFLGGSSAPALSRSDLGPWTVTH